MQDKNLIGMKFNRWVVIGLSEVRSTHLVCVCECGTQKEVMYKSLKTGHSKSCGCLGKEILIKRNTKHGLSKGKLYNSWRGMKERCSNDKNKEFHNYGARGIKVFKEWESFDNFLNWAISNGYEEGLTIERIDFDGNYEPNNCKWITNKEQARNKRNNVYLELGEEKMILKDWAKKIGISPASLRERLDRGWSIEKALTTKKAI